MPNKSFQQIVRVGLDLVSPLHDCNRGTEIMSTPAIESKKRRCTHATTKFGFAPLSESMSAIIWMVLPILNIVNGDQLSPEICICVHSPHLVLKTLW